MSIDEVKKEVTEFSNSLEEYRQMVEFGPLVSDLADAVLTQVRSEDDDLRYSCARAFGKFAGLMPTVLAIKDIEERKQKFITLTKEIKND